VNPFCFVVFFLKFENTALSFDISDHLFLFVQAFSVVFEKAIDRSEPAEEVKHRVFNLIDCITFSVSTYTTRGLFEKDKLIFTTQMCFQVKCEAN